MSELTQEQKFKFRYRMEQEAEQATGQPAPKASMGDVIAGTPLARFSMGLASPLIGAAQIGAHVGDVANQAMGVEPVVSPWIDTKLKEYEASKQRGMAASGTEGFDAMGLAGSILPGASIAKGVTAALPAAKNLGGRILQGMSIGGATSAAQPIMNTEGGFWGPKGIQTAVGTAVGGVVPLVTDAISAVGKTVKQAAQPFYEKGRDAILKEFREALMGQDPAVKQQMIQALSTAKPGVGGVPPTAGEVLADIPQATGLAAHQQAVSKMPGVSTQFAERTAAQEGARAAEIGNIAQTPEALAAAVKARGAASTQNYGKAFQEKIDPDKLVYHGTDKANDVFAKLMDRPSIKKAVIRATELAQEKGETFDPTSVKSLHYMKMAMDDLIKNPERFSIGATEGRAMAQTQKEFITWLGKNSPTYNDAREAHKAMSGPINRMQVGQELEKALRTPLDTGERASVFAKAADEAPRTIKKATGQAIFDKLEDVLQPQEVASVKAVAEELAKKDAFQRLARQTQVGGGGAIPGNTGMPIPNLLSRPAMIANFVLKHVGESAEKKIAEKAAGQYLNPQQLAEAMKDIPARYRPMIEALMQQAITAAGTAVGRGVQP